MRSGGVAEDGDFPVGGLSDSMRMNQVRRERLEVARPGPLVIVTARYRCFVEHL
jgi:hypothetical protein